ncbi:hypothetical protein GX48_05023 [Paracoccidioides brasiliensis]|nr:hypothetical protein GX48_05023 [Paracoccidioides brasiliensis]
MNVLYKTEAANMRNLTRKEPETPGTVKIESSHGVKPHLCRRDPEDSWHWGGMLAVLAINRHNTSSTAYRTNTSNLASLATEPFIMPPPLLYNHLLPRWGPLLKPTRRLSNRLLHCSRRRTQRCGATSRRK